MTLERVIEILRHQAECFKRQEMFKQEGSGCEGGCVDCRFCDVDERNIQEKRVAYLFAADKLEAVLQRGNKFGDTKKEAVAENDIETSLGISQGLYLNKAEVDALKEEASFMYEIMDSNKEGLARQGVQLAAILDFIFKTNMKIESDE